LDNGGRGFLGFSEVYAFNSALNTYSQSEYTIDPIYRVPWLDMTKTYNTQNVLSETDNTVVFSPGPSSGIFTQQLNQVTENTLAGATNTTNYYYDAYGNVTPSVVNIDINNNLQNTTTNTSYIVGSSLVPANPNYSEPSSVSTTTTRNGQPSLTSSHAYTYNSANLLSQDVSTVGSSTLVNTKTYSYDGYGNVILGTIAGYNSPSTTINTTYDSKGRFPIETDNNLSPNDPLYQSTTTTFDPLWGKATQETDIAGNITTHQYDEWGRIIKTTLPANPTVTNVITTSYNWDINTSSPPYTYWNTQTQWNANATIHGQSDVTIWYDQLGKETKTQTDAYNGILTTTKSYDNIGNLSTETVPYLPNEIPPMQTSYTYNSLNLLSTSTNFQGQTTYTYLFGNGITTVQTTGPNVPSGGNAFDSKIIDATGKITSVTDGGGTLNFTYDSWGNKLTAAHANGSHSITLLSNVYDQYGRLQSTTNNNGLYYNTATTHYQYDDRNRLTQETDPLGNVHTYQYDDLNRVTQRVGTGPNEGTTTYQYYPAAYYNKVQTVTDFNGRIENYMYNAYDGSLNAKIEAYNGNVVDAETLTYDGYGHLAEKKRNLDRSRLSL